MQLPHRGLRLSCLTVQREGVSLVEEDAPKPFAKHFSTELYTAYKLAYTVASVSLGRILFSK